MPSVTLTGTAGPAFAFNAEELFVDMESATVDIEPEFEKTKTNALGIINNRAQGPMQMVVSMSGQTKVKSVTAPYTGSLLLSALGTAFVPVNTYSTLIAGTNISAIWGAPTTGLYLMKGSLKYSASDYVGFDITFQANAGIA